MAEFDVLSNNRVVVGASVLRGSSSNGDRRVSGAYTRLGFGAWGILAQHNHTDRKREDLSDSFSQHASFAQVFWRGEWLVASVIGERLSVHQPFEERLNAGALEVTTRLTSVATIGATARVQRDVIAHQWSKSILLQVALKTVY